MKPIFYHHVQIFRNFMTDVNQKIQCFAYVKCFSGNNFYPYVQIKTLDPFHPKKKAFKRNLLSCKGVYTTLVCIF